MRLPWKHRLRRDWHVPDTGGREARQRAEQALEETQAETEKYAELARSLREIRRRNHLGEAFLHIAGGKHT